MNGQVKATCYNIFFLHLISLNSRRGTGDLTRSINTTGIFTLYSIHLLYSIYMYTN